MNNRGIARQRERLAALRMSIEEVSTRCASSAMLALMMYGRYQGREPDEHMAELSGHLAVRMAIGIHESIEAYVRETMMRKDVDEYLDRLATQLELLDDSESE